MDTTPKYLYIAIEQRITELEQRIQDLEESLEKLSRQKTPGAYYYEPMRIGSK